jgi:hypothetical protein
MNIPPPPHRYCADAYHVMICNNDNAYYKNAWTPIGNGWGYPYSIKGFAINKAKRSLSWFGTAHKAFARVINVKTGEDVWRCPNLIKEWGEVDG